MPAGLSIKSIGFREWLRDQFLEKKLNTAFGKALLAVCGLLLAGATALLDYRMGPAAAAAFALVLLLILFLRYPYSGFYFLLAFSSVTPTIDRLIALPFSSGLLTEIFLYCAFASVALRADLRKHLNRRFWMNPIGIGIFALFAYYFIEFFNPAMLGRLGWLSFIRNQLNYFVFFMMAGCLLNSRARIAYFMKFMIVLGTLLALYACKQQWFGYAGFELRSIGTGRGLELLLQGGLFRKFSVFSDPATSGIFFAGISLLCIVLFIRTDSRRERIWLGPCAFINLLGYSYSGTRTATLMIVAGILLYGLSTLNEKRTVAFLLFFVALAAVFVVLPFHNPITSRIRSTFEGTRDASAALRDYNRHQVQPYIQDHPLGGGIYTCGSEGPKYNEGHYLEYLQPDSGYMKTLAEQGAIGLALLLLFYFTIMRQGYYHFFRVRDPAIRSTYIALLTLLFGLMAAQYAQMAITQAPVTLLFQAIMVIFIRLADFDQEPSSQPIKTCT